MAGAFNSKDFQVPQTVKEFLLSDILEDTVPGSYFLSEEKTAQLVSKRLGNVNRQAKGWNGEVYLSRGLAPTLTRGKGEGTKIAIPVLTPDRLEKRQHGRRFKGNDDPDVYFNLAKIGMV